MEQILIEEQNSIVVENGSESVFELFKVKVLEAVSIAKHISLEHKGAAWQFWSDVSSTLKQMTGAEEVSLRIDETELTSGATGTGSSFDHTYIPALTVVGAEIVTPSTDNDYDDSEPLYHPDSIPMGEVTELPESPLKNDKGTNVIDSELLTSDTAQVKRKRSRGRPRKASKKADSVDPVPCSTEVEKLIEAITATAEITPEVEKCKLCGMKIDVQIQDQKVTDMTDDKNRCSGCGNVIIQKRKGRRKAAQTSASSEFLCSLCEMSFHTKQELVSHQLTTHPDDEDNNHDERFEDTENINTVDPDWRSGKRSKRLRHKKIKTEGSDAPETPKKRGRKRLNNMIPGKTSCDICGANLSNESALEVHMRKHSGEKPFNCKLCGKAFTTKCNMQRHEKTHSGAKPYKCEECNKWFTEKKSVKVHMRSHTGEKPYMCTICGRSFAQTGILQSHMDLHTGHKGHLCDFCGKAFRQKCQLRMHQKRHFNKRSYKCDQCGACFVTKGDMDRHRLKHTGERPYLCTHCPKSFTRMQYLREHVNQHTGTKPYSCNLCESSFHDLSTYHRHLRKHKLEEERKVAVIYAEEEQEKTTVYLTNEVDPGSHYEQSDTSEHSQVPLSHSVLTQNASGGYELTYLGQRILEDAEPAKEMCHDGDRDANTGDLEEQQNLTLVLTPEDINQLQGVRHTSEFSIADLHIRAHSGTEDVHNLQQLKITEASNLSNCIQTTRLVTSTSNGQTYRVTYVEPEELPQEN